LLLLFVKRKRGLFIFWGGYTVDIVASGGYRKGPGRVGWEAEDQGPGRLRTRDLGTWEAEDQGPGNLGA